VRKHNSIKTISRIRPENSVSFISFTFLPRILFFLPPFSANQKKTTYIPCQSLTLTLKLTKNFSSFQVKNRKRNWAERGGGQLRLSNKNRKRIRHGNSHLKNFRKWGVAGFQISLSFATVAS
jgi:hypothetical protein